MRLLAILLSLAANRYIEDLERWRPVDGFFRYAALVKARLEAWRLWDGPLAIALILGPVVLGAVLLQWFFRGWLFGLPALAFNTVVLIYCLGPERLDDHLDHLLVALDEDDAETARAEAKTLFGEDAGASDDLASETIDGLLVRGSERLYGVLFWFAVLGPVGAVVYRTALLSRDFADRTINPGPSFRGAVSGTVYVLAWVPARLAALSFALAGNMGDAMHGWNMARSTGEDGNRAILLGAGRGALGLGPDHPDANDVRAARQLLGRTLVVWLAVLAVLSIVGWLR